MTRAQAFTFASGLSRFGARRHLASRTESFLVGCILGVLIAWLLIATVTANAADLKSPQKIRVDDLIEAAAWPGHPLVGQQFDTVGALRAFTGKPGAWLVGNLRTYRAVLDLGELSQAEREAIYDQCDPTPCIARVVVTLLPKPSKDGYAQFTLDGWK